MKSDAAIPDQLAFRRRDKSLILDDPKYVNPKNQDEGVDDNQDNDSNGDSDDDDDTPNATHDAGAPHAEAPLQDVSQEELPEHPPIKYEQDVSQEELPINEHPIKHEDNDSDESIEDQYIEELIDDVDMPTLVQQDDSDSDSDSDSDDEEDDNESMPPLVERDSDYDSDGSDDLDEDEDVNHKTKPVHSHNLRRNPKPSFKSNYGTNATY